CSRRSRQLRQPARTPARSSRRARHGSPTGTRPVSTRATSQRTKSPTRTHGPATSPPTGPTGPKSTPGSAASRCRASEPSLADQAALGLVHDRRHPTNQRHSHTDHADSRGNEPVELVRPRPRNDLADLLSENAEQRRRQQQIGRRRLQHDTGTPQQPLGDPLRLRNRTHQLVHHHATPNSSYVNIDKA